MSLNSITVDIFNSRKYLLEILEEQGYNVNEYKNLSMSEIHAMIQTKQLDLLVEKSDPNKKIYIKYHLAKTLRLNNIQDYIEDLFNIENILSKDDDLIIIIKEEPNETINKILTDIWEHENIYIRIINIKKLQFNILNHDLVPKHYILNKKDEDEFKVNYNISNIDKNILPTISRFDPVAIMIGIRPNQVCKIERNSKTAINTIYYRICV